MTGKIPVLLSAVLRVDLNLSFRYGVGAMTGAGLAIQVLLLCVLALRAAADGACPGLEQLDDGVFLCPGQHGVVFVSPRTANVGFIVGEQCVAVIDTGGNPDEGRALAAAIEAVSTKPVCYVINTHVHPDHILGNEAFAGGNVQFVGHHNLTRAMAMLGSTYLRRAAETSGKNTSDWLLAPDRLVSEPAEIDLGGRRLLLTPHSRAHTDNDLSVYDEKTRTLWAGDLLFAEHIPVLGGSGSVVGWHRVVGTLRDSGANTVVPGHGPVLRDISEAVAAQLRYLEVLRGETRAWIADGGDIGSALDHIGTSERDRWAMFDQYHKRNVSYAYTELEWED